METVGTFLIFTMIIFAFIYFNFSQIYDYLEKYILEDENVNIIKMKMVNIDKTEKEKMKKENPTFFDKLFDKINEYIYNIINFPNTFFSNIYEYFMGKLLLLNLYTV
uniref:Uncharacterized protein n=1 Tax=viral metagenome TaxID=1070528 RepID=A0A6C0HXX3_9ZZZZ